MIKPEGNVYFAGEHLSPHHAWIEGSLESAYQVVAQMAADHAFKTLPSGDHSKSMVVPDEVSHQHVTSVTRAAR